LMILGFLEVFGVWPLLPYMAFRGFKGWGALMPIGLIGLF
jgi:hypothetical protein